ncbi:MAG: hypothetical protein HZB46_05055 [Solirubrobacterales bacterium]|nr:hypothetical protein [Solirubrobacterales bacterium]
MVLRSLSDRLGVEPARLRAAGAAVAREQWARRKAGSKPDLAALKQELAASLGDKLGLPADKVLEAVRAELEQRLGQAAAFGMVSEKGRALALACFDAPAACDLRALRREVRLPSRHPWHG